MSERISVVCSGAGRRIFFIRLIVLLLVYCTLTVRAQPAPAGQPAQLLLRPPSTTNIDNSGLLISSTLPPTELRIIYPEDSGSAIGQEFPNRIRLSVGRSGDDAQVRTPQRVTEAGVALTSSTPPLQAGDNDFINPLGSDGASVGSHNGGSGLPSNGEKISAQPFPVLVPFETSRKIVIGQVRDVTATLFGIYPPSDLTVPLSNSSETRPESKFKEDPHANNAQAPMYPNVRIMLEQNASYGTTISPYVVGNITVGALIGIITGIIVATLLGTLIGLACYKRKNSNWGGNETDLKVLGSHYGSYWDDKTLPNYQFNDRMIWPGEGHDEILALDNDAFLKSLEDLGRVSSRPSSKTNFDVEQQDQKISTKV